MSFEIATASADDVRRIMGWAKDEGWIPPTPTGWPSMRSILVPSLIGRLDGEPVVSISVTRYGAGFGFLGCYIARPVVRGKGYGLQIWNAGMKRLAGATSGSTACRRSRPTTGSRVIACPGTTRATRACCRRRHRCRRASALPMRASSPFDKLAAYDRRFFPEARDSFLAPWITAPERTALVALKDGEIAGFGVIRAAVTGARIGPLYAASPRYRRRPDRQARRGDARAGRDRRAGLP